MLPSETTIPATVTVLAKRVARPVERANERILTVSLGGWEWDLYVPEDEFSAAMAGMVVDMRRREKEVLEVW
jgi:hypothetical protein